MLSRVRSPRPVSRHTGAVTSRLLALFSSVAVAALLAGCSGGGEPSADSTSTPTEASSSPSSSASPAPSDSSSAYLPVPAGVELSPQGSKLALGDDATVAFEPRQGMVGVLDVKVTKLEKTSFKRSFAGWDLSAQNRKAAPYFVQATLENTGKGDLGGRRVPLYVVDSTDTLVENASFSSTFAPCPDDRLPKKFGPGRTAKVCLVYLAPDKGKLTAVSFRPTQDFDPITWTGKVSAVSDRSTKGAKSGKGDKTGGGAKSGGGKKG